MREVIGSSPLLASRTTPTSFPDVLTTGAPLMPGLQAVRPQYGAVKSAVYLADTESQPWMAVAAIIEVPSITAEAKIVFETIEGENVNRTAMMGEDFLCR